jgi:hypothetical protein
MLIEALLWIENATAKVANRNHVRRWNAGLWQVCLKKRCDCSDCRFIINSCFHLFASFNASIVYRLHRCHCFGSLITKSNIFSDLRDDCCIASWHKLSHLLLQLQYGIAKFLLFVHQNAHSIMMLCRNKLAQIASPSSSSYTTVTTSILVSSSSTAGSRITQNLHSIAVPMVRAVFCSTVASRQMYIDPYKMLLRLYWTCVRA